MIVLVRPRRAGPACPRTPGRRAPPRRKSIEGTCGTLSRSAESPRTLNALAAHDGARGAVPLERERHLVTARETPEAIPESSVHECTVRKQQLDHLGAL